VRHEDRDVAIRRAGLAHQRLRLHDVGRKRDDTCEPVGMTHGSVQCDHTALREARDDYAPGRYPPRGLPRDQRLELRL
jgi:hypothetical protein